LLISWLGFRSQTSSGEVVKEMTPMLFAAWKGETNAVIAMVKRAAELTKRDAKHVGYAGALMQCRGVLLLPAAVFVSPPPARDWALIVALALDDLFADCPVSAQLLQQRVHTHPRGAAAPACRRPRRDDEASRH
jgi:hypothetical protein